MAAVVVVVVVDVEPDKRAALAARALDSVSVDELIEEVEASEELLADEDSWKPLRKSFMM